MRKAFIILISLGIIGCAQNQYMQGQRLVEQGQYDRGIETFYAEIKANPSSALAWRELGVAFYKKGDLAKAEEALKQANNIKPDPRTNLYLGLTYEKQEQYGTAIDAYRAALSLKPSGSVKNLVRAHLDQLISQGMNREVSLALQNESKIKVDTIPENTVAVVDFDNTHLPADLSPLSKGLAEFTSIDLSKIRSLRVVDRLKINIIMDELKLSSSQYADPKNSPRLGRLVGSRRIVTGSVLGTGDNAVRLDGAVVSVGDGATKTTSPTEGLVKSFFKIQKEFVFKVIDDLGITLTPEERDSIQKIPTESYLAFMSYCRGLDYRSRGMTDEARQEFKQAVTEDKGFVEASRQAENLAAYEPPAGSDGRFEPSVTKASDEESLSNGIAEFQDTRLSNIGFIRDVNALEQFGNTPDAPPRTGARTATVIIRGDLDEQP